MAPLLHAEDGFPKFFGIGDTGFAEAFAEEEKADFSVSYHHDGRLDIGVGPVSDSGILTPRTFTFDELRGFWKAQRHKDFVVVTLAKWNPTDAERDALVKRLTGYFFEVGFRRVRVHQGMGAGVGVLSDLAQEPKLRGALGEQLELVKEPKADFDLYHDHYDEGGALDLDIGLVSAGGVRGPVCFKMDDLRHFWTRQRHKEFVEVTLAKWSATPEERYALAQKLKAYFFEVGFRRVRIFQGAGTYTPAILDEVNPKVEAKASKEKNPAK